MKIVVLSNEVLKKELLAQGLAAQTELQWIDKIEKFRDHQGADACIDLSFDNEPSRVNFLKSITTGLVIINHVAGTLLELPSNFIRINGWTGFLNRDLIEASCSDKNVKEKADSVFAAFSKKTEWTPDIPGFVSARVISMIINEAYFALEEEVSTKEEIDAAMKLGTNYPKGPFEWSRTIGIKNVYRLLQEMAKTQKRYEPSTLLSKEAAE